MAIAFDSESQTKTTTGSTSYTHTVTGSNILGLVHIINQNNGGITSVTWGGVAMTLVDAQSDANVTNVYTYYLAGVTTGTVAVNRATASNTLYVFSLSYTGCSQTGIPDAKTKGANPNTGATLTATLTTIADNSWQTLAGYDGGGNLAANTGSTTRGSIQDTAAGCFDSNSAKTPAGSTSMLLTVSNPSNNNIAYIMTSFAPVGAVAAGDNFQMGADF